MSNVPIALNPSPPPLPENSGLAFIGEEPWEPALIKPRQAESFRNSANPSGRNNGDVLRGFLGLAKNEFQERWQIDFPRHLTFNEVELYEAPLAALAKKIREQRTDGWWINPHAQPALRNALARLDRFLVADLRAKKPAWTWVEGGWLPGESLLALARDDEFTQGILQSHVFTAWWDAGIPAGDPLRVLESFPFPWAPRTAFGALTGIQQDLRYEIGRAVRNQDQAHLTSVVNTAYGFPPELPREELLQRLGRLNLKRAGKA